MNETNSRDAELIEELQDRHDRLLRSNQELNDFASIVSHDLKEPLRGIRNYANILLEDYGDKLDADGQAKLEVLKRLSGRLEEMLDSLFQYSCVGSVDLALQLTDLNEIVEQALDLLRINLQENGVEVRLGGPLPTMLCDRARISDVFLNLLTNAMKFNDKVGKWIEIGAVQSPGECAVFYVRDNGIGIREEHFDSIFSIFKRLHRSTKFGEGTGVGLTIVKKIIERHQGRIWVKSVYGEGATFFFTLS